MDGAHRTFDGPFLWMRRPQSFQMRLSLLVSKSAKSDQWDVIVRVSTSSEHSVVVRTFRGGEMCSLCGHKLFEWFVE